MKKKVKKKTTNINSQWTQWKEMKLKKIIKNDWNQPGLTFRTCDTNYEIELQHKRQT
jgi:hypothetical protein